MPDDNTQIPDTDTDTDVIQEGEVVSEPVSEPVAMTLDLTGLINSHLEQISRLKQSQSKLKEMLQSIYDNDPTYQTHDAAVKEAVKVRNQTKKQLQRLPQAADLVGQIQELSRQVKEHSTSLSDYLQDYAKTTGSTTFETPDGQVKEIIYVAKLRSSSDK